MDELTPAECIEEYPQLKKIFGWDAKSIGVFLSKGLLKGTYNRNKRVSLIEKDSLLSLVKYKNSLLEKNKIKL